MYKPSEWTKGAVINVKGLDKLEFPAPLQVGDKVRLREALPEAGLKLNDVGVVVEIGNGWYKVDFSGNLITAFQKHLLPAPTSAEVARIRMIFKSAIEAALDENMSDCYSAAKRLDLMDKQAVADALDELFPELVGVDTFMALWKENK